MYGPSRRDFVALVVFGVLVGLLLGIGAQAGCSYVRKHVGVEWTR